MTPTHPGFSSAHDLIIPGPASGYSLASSDYPNAANKEADFLNQFSTSCKNEVRISFEPDNGWMDVDSTAGYINLLLAGSSSSYLLGSPYFPSSTGRTTLLPGTATGNHNPNANAAATIQYLDATSAGQGARVNFSLYNIGNITPGLDEAGLALEHPQVNIDRGTNTTTTGSNPNQFLEIVPSETAEGGLRVEFLGTDATGTAWSNPVYAFGFYLSGREEKRDVYLDVKDIYGNLIHSSVTTEGEIITPTAAVEYISFKVEANENPIGSFELREEYNGEDVIWRDIFSIDDLTLFTGLTYSGAETGYDEIPRNTTATSITDNDYPNAKSAHDNFISTIGTKTKETITFEPFNGWMDVDNPPGSLTSQNYQFIAGTSSAYSSVSTTNTTSGDSVTLKTGSNSGSHATTSSTGANGEVIHMDQNGSKVSFTLTNVANAVGADEPDLARVHANANIDRGINITSGSAPDTSNNYDQFLEILPNEKAEGQLRVSFEGTDNSGNSWSNPVYDLGFYLMGREIKRDVCLKVYDINGDLIHNEVTREPSTPDNAIVQYFSFSVNEDAPISYFTLTEDFNSSDTSDRRDIFSIDDLTFSTAKTTPTPSPGPTPTPTPDPTPTPIPTPSPEPIPTPSPDPTPTPSPDPTPTPSPDPTPTPVNELPADVSFLDANYISTLTPSAVSELTADQINDLSPLAFEGFTAKQVAELSNDSVAAFTLQQVKKLTAEAITGLSKSQVHELTPKAVKGFTSDQMESLSKSSLKALDDAQLAKLSKDAISGITSTQLKTLSGKEISVLKPKKISQIDPKAISGLKPKTLNSLSNSQAKALNDDQLGGLSKRQIRRADKFIRSLSERQIDGLPFDPNRLTRIMEPFDISNTSILPLTNSIN